ncbi:hypothetical protein NESM_000359300 [Novymonas esmeraldas]|uniref:Uncharacterized protein n=1 Tax=Novymonas esmeraldas TaxID=1808958 RepID=A0AAW0EJT2_9TRYP
MGARTSRAQSSPEKHTLRPTSSNALQPRPGTNATVVRKTDAHSDLTYLWGPAPRRRHSADEHTPPHPQRRRAGAANASVTNHCGNPRRHQPSQQAAATERTPAQPGTAPHTPRSTPTGYAGSAHSGHSIATVPHRPIRGRQSGGGQPAAPARDQTSRHERRAQRQRQCWTDSPYSGTGRGLQSHGFAGYVPFVATDTSHTDCGAACSQ